MKVTFFSLLLPCLLLIPSAFAQTEEPALHLLFDQRPPLLQIADGQLQGTVGQRARQALESAGIRYRLEEVPIPRQLKIIEANHEAVCAVGRLMNEQRRRHGQFSDPILRDPPYVAVTRGDFKAPAPLTLENWVTHAEFDWGLQAGLYYSDHIQQQITRAKSRILKFTANNQLFGSLVKLDRVDFVLVQLDEAKLMLDKDPTLRMYALNDTARPEIRFFYCSLQVPAPTMQALNHALRMLKP